MYFSSLYILAGDPLHCKFYNNIIILKRGFVEVQERGRETERDREREKGRERWGEGER